MALVIRTIGLARATVKIGLANLVYNICAAGSGSPPPPPDAHPKAQQPGAEHSDAQDPLAKR